MKHLLSRMILIVGLMATGISIAGEQTQSLAVEGMTCVSCPYIVREALKEVEGVTDVKVSLEDKLAVVTFDDTKTTVSELTEATSDVGFPSSLIE